MNLLKQLMFMTMLSIVPMNENAFRGRMYREGEPGAEGGTGGGEPEPMAFNDLNDDQLGELNLTEDQLALKADGKEVTLSDDQQTIMAKFTKPATKVDDAGTGAPDSYADFNIPDGVPVNEDLLNAYTPMFKEDNLSQEQAQRYVDKHVELLQAQEKASEDAYKGEVAKWVETTKADKELGGDNYDTTTKHTALAIKELGTPELSKFLDDYGIGSHPEIVRVLAKAGALLDEDSAGGGQPSTTNKSRAEIMYPTDTAANA